METKNGSSDSSGFTSPPVVYGVIASCVTTVLLLVVSSIFVTWSSVSDAKLPFITYTINVIAVVVGAAASARKSMQRGWYYGGLSALVYTILLAIIGIVLYRSSYFTLHNFMQLFIMTFIGGFGGIIGINTKR
jgi:putative membrane protein (TIGR04086 family)